jgi:hypothetical protein
MTLFEISEDCKATQYHGCGKAWAAIKDDKVVAIRYMDRCQVDRSELPKWVQAVASNSEGLDNHMLPTAWSSKGLSMLAAAAQACEDCPSRRNGSRYRPNELLRMSRAILEKHNKAEFAKYRQACRDELAQFGQVISGQCSCFEFIAS